MVYVLYCTSDLLGDTAASLHKYSTITIRYDPQKRFLFHVAGKFHVEGLDFHDSPLFASALFPQRTTHLLVLHFFFGGESILHLGHVPAQTLTVFSADLILKKKTSRSYFSAPSLLGRAEIFYFFPERCYYCTSEFPFSIDSLPP